MTLKKDDRLYLIKSYTDKSEAVLQDARDLVDTKPALSSLCSYDAAYHLTIALFVSRGLEVPRSHEGINQKLYEFFVNGEKSVPNDISRLLGRLETNRNVAHYSVTKTIDRDAAQKDLERAETYAAHIRTLVDERVKEIENTPADALEVSIEEEINSLGLVPGKPKIYLSVKEGVPYKGPILYVNRDRGFSVQQSGRASLLVHRNDALERIPTRGETVQIVYDESGKAKVKEREK